MRFRRPAMSPVAWVTVEKLTQQILWLILFAILAPILGPRPYGLFSIVMVFVGFCEYVLIAGTTEALVTVEKLDHLHTTTANFASGASALVLGLVMSALAPAIGALFHDTEITRLMWGLAPLPVISALSAAPIAVLLRNRQFKQLAIRSILGLTIGGIFGIVLAVAGAGVWALALQVLAQRFAELIIVWIAAPVRLAFRWSGSHFREMAPVGMNVFSARIMNFAGTQLPRIILGYELGPTELGLFTLATRFLDIVTFTTIAPRTVVGRIELRDSKPGSPQFERTFSTMVQNVSFLSAPILLGIVTLIPSLFRFWLDHRWEEGVLPAQLILFGGLPLVLTYCIDSAFLAANLSSLFSRTATIQAVTITATMVCAAPFGLNITCLALAVRSWVLLPVFLLLLRRSCHLPLRSFLWSPLRSLTGALIMAALLNLPVLRSSQYFGKFDLILLVAIGMVIYGAFAFGFARDQLKGLLTGIFGSRA